ncbi:MAG: ATP-binding cassette domain-containing protein [Christensenellaceae bacterium]|jgi:ATPase subunit of ABC transporter with duplicated ATPase domains|nr:ATP-binding cassette domain-containing protein [Christensenellaceae bacterium]
MISASNITLQYGKRVLFKDVNIKFLAGECYGIIGANGAGKSTFLKILSGEIPPNKGEVIVDRGKRISILRQDQNALDGLSCVEAVISGHEKLYRVMKEKEAMYLLTDFTEAQGNKLAELEGEFAEMGGWEADADARIMLTSLGIPEDKQDAMVGELDAKLKVKVLLASALFGNPDILILDEPTNNLDIKAVHWLEDFLYDFRNTVIIVSHNRYFLNKVCTRICDVDYGAINMFVGNYDFWYETSQLLLRQQKEANKKAEARADELKEFIARFSANASKSRQATSRKRELEKLTIEDLKPSSRKYPYINFDIEREVGNEVLAVKNLTLDGYFKNVSFRVNKGEKVAFLSDNSLIVDKLFDCIASEAEATSGEVEIGKTIKTAYLPQNFDKYFDGVKLNLVEWLKGFSKDTNETFIRSWLGRMLFSGEEALKEAGVLSGGEKVRCMLAKTMLAQGNLLIMSEPTNHLDLESITALNEGMKKYKGVMLFATSDEEIMATVATRIIYITKDKVIDRMCGYEEYLEKGNVH